MKRAISVLIILGMMISFCFCLSACKFNAKPSGTYYSKEVEGLYFVFDSDTEGRMVFESAQLVTSFTYVVGEKDQTGNSRSLYLTDSTGKLNTVTYYTDIDELYDSSMGYFSK